MRCATRQKQPPVIRWVMTNATPFSTNLTEYADEIDDIVNETTWNGKKLLDGLQCSGFGGNITFQTGAEAMTQTNSAVDDLVDVLQ